MVAALSKLKSRPSHNGPEDLVFASSNGMPLDERNLSKRHLHRPPMMSDEELFALAEKRGVALIVIIFEQMEELWVVAVAGPGPSCFCVLPGSA